jgi:hypothetical protein
MLHTWGHLFLTRVYRKKIIHTKLAALEIPFMGLKYSAIAGEDDVKPSIDSLNCVISKWESYVLNEGYSPNDTFGILKSLPACIIPA